MGNISLGVVGMVIGSLVFQLVGIFLLPMTRGFTDPLPTLGSALGFLIGIGFLARLSTSGMNISILIPLISALNPLGALVIGVLVYGDSAPFAKIAMLVTACVLIGVAGIV
ncbi:hypothetical protein F9288_13915 [Sphingomonas sp. CL5.1]|uniref:hypothetical protein n=1 Tax=Sphingomonas sp. CL5.1 TaxID=2653203 RepID=UPI001583B1A3|nr:hypothetical protein [Sphingomonas sp. CL5.1]QKS00595.1 hypothetical protein F9288_13915 [Sphingomonas sp. CL5.1]